jgi:hypothetical protein
MYPGKDRVFHPAVISYDAGYFSGVKENESF